MRLLSREKQRRKNKEATTHSTSEKIRKCSCDHKCKHPRSHLKRQNWKSYTDIPKQDYLKGKIVSHSSSHLSGLEKEFEEFLEWKNKKASRSGLSNHVVNPQSPFLEIIQKEPIPSMFKLPTLPI